MWQRLMAFIQSLEFVTQSAHFFAGGFVTLAASKWLGWIAPAAFICLWAAPKELLVDNYKWGEGHGEPDWLDLLFYCLGTAAACGVMLL